MKVLEIKNNLVKIVYDVKDNLALSGFVIIEDENTPYVAQIMNLDADEDLNAATVKLLFTFNKEGIVKNYDGTVPSVNAVVTKLPAKELLDILPIREPLKIGNLAQQKSALKVDFSLLERDLVTCVETSANKNTLIKNFILQLENKNKKSVIFDTDGLYDNDDKVVFGYDFKLPLNFETIDFIYENDLNDVDEVNKAVIQDIFLEVQEYTKTVKDGFIPFDSFINVVDAQYRETEIPQLILLKNKLLKYKEQNVFAQNLEEIESLRTALKVNTTLIIDLSVAQETLQREIISHVYDVIESLNQEYYSFVTITNTNSDKKLLKKFLTEEDIYTSIFCRHEYKYLPELKQYASNLLLFAPQTTQHDFASYNSFLNKLNSDEFIIYGNLTQNIPFIIELDEINLTSEDENITYEEAFVPEPVEPQEPAEDVVETIEPDEEVSEQEVLIETPDVLADNTESQEFETYTTEEPEESNSVEEKQEEEQEEGISSADVLVDNQEFDEFEPYTAEEPEESNSVEEEQDVEISSSNVDMPDTEDRDALVQQAVKDVDTMFYSNLTEEIPSLDDDNAPEEASSIEDETDSATVTEPESEIEIEPVSESADDSSDEDFDFSEMDTLSVEDELTEDDLDFIDEIQNSDDTDTPEEQFDFDNAIETDSEIEIVEDEQPEESLEIQEELSDAAKEFQEVEPAAIFEDTPSADTKEEQEVALEEEESSPAPEVPLYDADEFLPQKDVETFEQGDTVSHPKYGQGVVEKMIKYGSKTLCSINFENIGRRLLDPAISEITKL